MREIKFRAWHKKQSKMIYDVQKTEMVHHAMSSMAGEPSGLDHYFDEKWYELMQYTGLKDNNDQEIYEGDIVEVKTDWFYRFDHSGEIYFSDKKLSYYYKCTSNDEVKINWDISEKFKCEVIGNIYEQN